MIARGSVDVTFQDVDASRIPDALVEGASLLLDLRRRGVVDEVAKRVKIRRQGGFCGLDVWLTVLLYMTVGAEVGVRKFWDVARPHVAALAALAGRRRLPSPASLSRALDAVETELLREEASWLLTGIADVDAVLRNRSLHPAYFPRLAPCEALLTPEEDSCVVITPSPSNVTHQRHPGAPPP